MSHDDDMEAIKAIFRAAGRSDDDTSEQAPRGDTPKREAPTSRVTLPGISPRAYEHPADRAALTAMRKVPGFEAALRKMVGFVDERSLRHLYLASAVKASPRQYTRVYRLFEESVQILDLHEVPDLFVAQTPLVNAGAVGVERPFVVLNSGTVDLLDDDELRFVLGHELGHILSDHVLYKTMLRMFLRMSMVAFGLPLGRLAVMGLLAGLKEWDRKSELSCDRAGLLTTQSPEVAYRVHMKMAGGLKPGQSDMDLGEFIKQAEAYEAAGDVTDGMVKLLNLLGTTHPFHVIRLLELKRWVDAGHYDQVLKGHYPEREDDGEASVYDGVAEGARSYREAYERSKDPLAQFVTDLGQSLSEVGQQVKGWFGGKDDDRDRRG
ncbi:MAG: M48 family metallopeptidase [Bradymonadia bacterium]